MVDQQNEVLTLRWKGVESARLLADKLAQKLPLRLFTASGDLLYLDAGKMYLCSREMLQELIGTHWIVCALSRPTPATSPSACLFL